MTDLRVGDTVEIKTSDEILATLDSRGTLEDLPFMPEMLKYCGQQHKVYKRADKTSQYITSPRFSSRRMLRTVHLEGLRCNGEYHDGCDAFCLLYWKDAWLKRVGTKNNKVHSDREDEVSSTDKSQKLDNIECTIDRLLLSTKIPMDPLNSSKEKYFCQVTEVINASSELKRWDLRQYYRDLRSGNICVKDFAKWAPLEILNWAYGRITGRRIYPFIDGRFTQRAKTPFETLNLQVGDYVKIKSLEEILLTLDINFKNRGLLFTEELIPYCGKTSRVTKIVKRIVNEANREMVSFPNICIILEDVICTGQVSNKRLFCPKSCYPYWREIWLRKIY